jgi:uncharacterized membrane protein YccF (DUF307 family)
MPIRGADGVGLGGAVKEVTERASSLAKLEIELAKLELKKKVAKFGIGIGLIAGSLLFLLFGLGFLLAGIAAAIATALPVWGALLLTALGLFLVAGACIAIGVGVLKHGKPVPEQAIDEARKTSDALKANGRH